jgi:hypothetical protein
MQDVHGYPTCTICSRVVQNYANFQTHWNACSRVLSCDMADCAWTGTGNARSSHMQDVHGGVRRSKREREIQERLCEEIEGKIEVTNVCGRADIITSDQLIEVKEFRNWKCAVGQLVSYALSYPNHRKRLHVFGRVPDAIPASMATVLETYDIELTIEPRS